MTPRAWQTTEPREVGTEDDCVPWSEEDSDRTYWRLMDEATRPATGRPATATDDPDDDMPW